MDEINPRDHQAAQEPLPAYPLDPSAGLDVEGPTVKQELFLRRQKLWQPDLKREQATRVIGEFLARKTAERLERQRCDGAATPSG